CFSGIWRDNTYPSADPDTDTNTFPVANLSTFPVPVPFPVPVLDLSTFPFPVANPSTFTNAEAKEGIEVMIYLNYLLEPTNRALTYTGKQSHFATFSNHTHLLIPGL